MKAVAVVPAKSQVKLADHAAPTISSPAQVKLRMLDVGVCGTDREICAFEYGTPPRGDDYLVIGHESLGEVDTDLIMRNLVLKNQVVYGTVNAGPEAFESAIRDLGQFMTRWPDAVRSLITGRFPIDAYRDLLLGVSKGIKNVLAIG